MGSRVPRFAENWSYSARRDCCMHGPRTGSVENVPTVVGGGEGNEDRALRRVGTANTFHLASMDHMELDH